MPTLDEMLRIQAWLVVSRNATRDYRDTAALADRLGRKIVVSALEPLDGLYPLSNGSSALQQLAPPASRNASVRSRRPRSFGHRSVRSRWNGWAYVSGRCLALATDLVLFR